MKKKIKRNRDGLGATEERFEVKKVNSMLEKLTRDGRTRKARRKMRNKWSQAADEVFNKKGKKIKNEKPHHLREPKPVMRMEPPLMTINS